MPNPLLDAADRPFGLPDFTVLETEHHREALEAGMAEQRAELEAIVGNPDEPTFDNTVRALEASGRLLGLARRIFHNQVAADSDDALRALDSEFAPLLAAHGDALLLDPELFARVSAVREALDGLGLDAESRFLVERTWRRMQLAGAGLDDPRRFRLMEVNQELSRLMTRFQENLLTETNDLAVPFRDPAELDGLSDSQLSACRAAAEARGLDGFLVTLVLFSDHPFLAQLTQRESRRRLYEASTQRCNRGNEHDNNALVSRITALRAERAGLLGHPNHAAVVAADETAGTPERIDEVVQPLVAPALANLEGEAQSLQSRMDADHAARGVPAEPLAPWDWSFYAEQVRRERHAVDTAGLSSWFEYERVLTDGVFWTATQLYGISFVERPDLVAYHPQARTFEVLDVDGSTLGLFIHDVFTRDSKRGGAWMNNLVEQNHLFGELPVVCNNLNVPQPAEGEPVLLTLDEVTTMFHEFGHALHGLLSDATYPSLSGTNVSRDFVEFPSQVNEMWITWPEVVAHYARHHTTGEPIPAQVLQAMEAASTFNEGFNTTEYLASALLDQQWHRLEPGAVVDDVQAFEREALDRIGLANPWIGPRYRSTYFSHTFAGGYDAGYYSYIFSEVLDADTVEWFTENGGLLRENGQRFRDEVLSRGLTRDPLQGYRAFRGRDARIEPLLARRGLG